LTNPEAWADYRAVVKPAWHAYEAVAKAADQQYKAVNKAAFDRCMSMIAVADQIFRVSRDREAYMATLEEAFTQYEATMRTADEVRKKASAKAWSRYEAVARPAWDEFESQLGE
jgi:hypothetical protein